MAYLGRILISFAIFPLYAALLVSPGLADDKNTHIGKAIEGLPLFDAHVHYNKSAWDSFPPGTIVELMDKSGVAMALVSSTSDEGTIRLWKFAPNRIVPELRPYQDKVGLWNWTKTPDIFNYIVKRLDAYPHQGIGEFHLHRVDPRDEPLLRKIAEQAKSRNIFIHVHSEKEPVKHLFSIEPKLKIIWAHAGLVEPPEVVEELLATYKTLYADTSYRERDILTEEGTIEPAWRRVLERFSDRFMIGSDTWLNDQWENYERLITTNRKWLSQFSRPVAERIAYKNAERLFGRKVEKQLIGQRP